MAGTSFTPDPKLLQDLGNFLNELGNRNDLDISKKMNLSGATSQLIEFNGAIGNMYNLQDKILDQLDRQQKYNDNQIDYYKKEKKDHADDKKYGEALDKRLKLLLDRNKNLAKQRKDAINGTGVFNKLTSAQAIKTQALSAAQKALGSVFAVGRAVAEGYMVVLKQLAKVSERVLKWQDSLQKSLSGLAIRFGTTTDAIVGMRDEGLKQLMDVNGLGGLGLSLEEIVGKLADFNEAMVFTNKVSQAGAADMVKFGMGIGLTASQTGELARSFLLAGQTMSDAKKYMRDIASAAAQARVSSASLAKQFQGAGKMLYDLSGPQRRKDLVHTAMELAKIGTGLDKISGFVEMSMNFDQTASAMARLNTAFGTYINTLDVFAEDKPEKQFQIIQDSLANAGIDLNNISMTQKKLLAEILHMDAATIDAMITRGKMTQEQKDAEDAIAAAEKKKAEAQGAYEDSLKRSKTMLIAEQTITANINNMLTKQMAPFYDGWAKGGGILSGAKMFDSYVDKWDRSIAAISKKLGEQGLGAYLAGIGETFGKLWDAIVDFVSSDSVATFLTGIAGLFEMISDIIAVIVTAISPLLKGVLFLVGKLSEAIGIIWKFFKFFGTGIFGALTNISGGKGSMARGAEEATRGQNEQINTAMQGFLGQAKPLDTSDAMVVAGAPEDKPSAKAAGGPVEAGKYYMVGEKGPELFQSPANGNITPAPQTAAMLNGGGEQIIHVNVSIDSEKIQDIMYKTSIRRQA